MSRGHVYGDPLQWKCYGMSTKRVQYISWSDIYCLHVEKKVQVHMQLMWCRAHRKLQVEEFTRRHTKVKLTSLQCAICGKVMARKCVQSGKKFMVASALQMNMKPVHNLTKYDNYGTWGEAFKAKQVLRFHCNANTWKQQKAEMWCMRLRLR